MEGVACVAFVGKQNNPLYLKNFTNDEDVKYHYLVNTSLDILEEKASYSSRIVNLYQGQLYRMEDFRAFGYVTNTKIKIIVITSSPEVRDAEIRKLLSSLHDLYVQVVMNPFFDTVSATKIDSRRFTRNVERIVKFTKDE